MADWTEAEVTTKVSPVSVTDTAKRLADLLSAKSLKAFAVIDQSAEARQVGQQLRETVQRCVSYCGPAALAARYHLSADLEAKLAAIDSLTDALIAQ